MSDNGERVMWEEDYIKLKAEQRANLKKRQELKAQQVILTSEEMAIKNQLPYSEQLATEICERISAGELFINICNEKHMPSVRQMNRWLKANSDFATLYKESIQDRLSIFEEQIIQIADDAANDFKEILKGDKVIRTIDSDVIARAKLRVEMRLKHLKAGRPQKWSESTTLITKNEEAFDPTAMSNEELEKQIADIEAKDSIVKAV